MQGDITLIGNSLTHLAGNLTTLDLSDNFISGNLSGTIIQNNPPGDPLAALRSSSSGSSNPNPLCALVGAGLQYLNFQGNLITGNVPACLFILGMPAPPITLQGLHSWSGRLWKFD